MSSTDIVPQEDDAVVIGPDEEARQAQDIDDAAFDGIIVRLQALLEMFRSDAASSAVATSENIKDISPLRDYIAKRNNEAFNATWEAIRFVQNLRQ